MSIADALLPEFDREMGVTRRLLERVPDGQFTWQPHAKSMTLGRLAEHLAELPQWVGVTVAQDGFDMGTSRRPDGYVPPARAALAGKTDAELMAPWTFSRGGQVMFTMPKAGVLRSFVLNHLVHHRGQLSVYLRLHDVPLPSIYGPSGDEAM
jgi:uncharacterized damage-inducible protein DinB